MEPTPGRQRARDRQRACGRRRSGCRKAAQRAVTHGFRRAPTPTCSVHEDCSTSIGIRQSASLLPAAATATMNAAHRFLWERRAPPRPQSAEQQVRLAIEGGRRQAEAYALEWRRLEEYGLPPTSPTLRSPLTRPSSAVALHARPTSALARPRSARPPSPPPRPSSAHPKLKEAPVVLKRRPSPDAYLSDGRPRRRPVSATRQARRPPGSPPSLLARFPGAPPPSAAEDASPPPTPGSPPRTPPLHRSWSGGLLPASPSYHLAPSLGPRVWLTVGGQYLEQRDAERRERRAAAKKAREQPQIGPARLRSHSNSLPAPPPHASDMAVNMADVKASARRMVTWNDGALRSPRSVPVRM